MLGGLQAQIPTGLYTVGPRCAKMIKICLNKRNIVAEIRNPNLKVSDPSTPSSIQLWAKLVQSVFC